MLKNAYFVPSDLRNQFYEYFWTGSGHFLTGSRTRSAQKLHILAPLASEINLMNIYGLEVDIFRLEVNRKCSKITNFGLSDFRNKVFGPEVDISKPQEGSEVLKLHIFATLT